MHCLVKRCGESVQLIAIKLLKTEEVYVGQLPSAGRLSKGEVGAAPMVTIDELLSEILQFRDARNWGQFHSPRHVAAALSIEASEVQELMLWKTDAEVAELLRSLKGKRRVEEEIADVLIYAFLLSHEVGVDPAHAVLNKLQQNAKKYPVGLSRGTALKYSELPDKKREEVDAIQESLFPGNPPH